MIEGEGKMSRVVKYIKAGFPLANIFARSDFFLLSQPN